MKRPSITLDKQVVVDFLLRHAEKFVVGVLGLAALGLAWGGVDAVRNQAVTAARRPELIEKKANDARLHIDREPTAPPEDRPQIPPLAKVIDPWREPAVAAADGLAQLDRPLFSEFARRSQPTVFPLEDLRAVAGLAVVRPKPKPAPAPEEPRRDPPRGGQAGGDGGRPPAGSPPQVQNPDPKTQDQKRILPYVVVTGLIPVARQKAEYRQKFDGVGLPLDKDTPRWSVWIIERTVVGPGSERWEMIKVTDIKRQEEEWSGAVTDDVPGRYRLQDAEEQRDPAKTPPYCGPLPALHSGGWGRVALHPWVVDQVRRPAAPDANTAGQEAEFRMFRFIDTTVEPGRRYRYRVQLSLVNPNVGVEARHLADPETARKELLVAPRSAPTAEIAVPDASTILVKTLGKASLKKKPLIEVFVLGESRQTGGYALRSLVTEPGGLVNVDEKLNKPSEKRTRGEPIDTGRVVVDVRGSQEEPDRADAKGGKPAAARFPEPFEVLCLRPDGGFDVASAADSALLVDEHAATLPGADEAGRRDAKPGPKDPVQTPFGSPFGK